MIRKGDNYKMIAIGCDHGAVELKNQMITS